MNFNNTFAKAMKKQLDQGRRAQFSMLIKARNLYLPIAIQIKLFESIVCPNYYMARKFGDFKKLTCWKSFIENFSKIF